MSQSLKSDLAMKTVDESLIELDNSCQEAAPSIGTSTSIGPFSVLNLGSQASKPYESKAAGNDNREGAMGVLSEEAPSISDSVTEQWTFPSGVLDWADLFELEPDMDTHAERFNGRADFVYDTTLALEAPLPEVVDALTQPALPVQVQTMPYDDRIFAVNCWSESLRFGTINVRFTDIRLLLRNFTDHVVSQMTPMPLGSKSVWEILNVESALSTLAKAIFNNATLVSSAATANFFALCAISAQHLATRWDQPPFQGTGNWRSFAAEAIMQAKENMKTSLRNETTADASKAKYKDQLMGLLAILSFTILYDHQQEARKNVIETEKLLRKRGLAKRHISRKSRMLHHVYTWVRILGESTHLSPNVRFSPQATKTKVCAARRAQRYQHMTHGDQIAEPASQSREIHNTRLDDFLRLDTQHYVVDTNDSKQKDRDTGLNDIHLEDIREWSENLYMELYGISETWLCLVSQTARLANAMDGSVAHQSPKGRHLRSLERRKARLEDMVCKFVADSSANLQPSQVMDASLSLDGQARTRSCMVRALNSALVIYFYRRIRNVNPLILQEHVNNVMQAMQDFEMSCRINCVSGPGSPWPSFMAGCESITNAQRAYFTTWFDSAIELTGFSRLQSAKACMLEVWRRRDLSSSNTERTTRIVSWIEVCRDQGISLLLS